jgi:hypothetical protein
MNETNWNYGTAINLLMYIINVCDANEINYADWID